ncbi:MAG: Hsp33 family molecular chaperone HslO [Betaproteobacteria bacterium]|nr:Hsp33 family molecular chaperone HslO [Betaproteobacteria bacterium]
MPTDYVQHFLFEDLDIRGRLVCLGDAWRRMIEGRTYPERIAMLLGHTTTLAVLLGASGKNRRRVTLQVQGSGPVGLLVADCTSELRIRGMAQYDGARAESLGERQLLGDGRLALTFEELDTGRIYQSLVPLEGETIEDIFALYLSQSEQLTAFLRLYASGDALCGLLLEKLPRADTRDPDGWNRASQLAATLTLAETRDTRPHALLTRLFPDELLRVFPLRQVEYHCPRDIEKVKNVLRGMGRAEIDAILAERGEVVIRNEMCNHEYRFDRDAVEVVFTEH